MKSMKFLLITMMTVFFMSACTTNDSGSSTTPTQEENATTAHAPKLVLTEGTFWKYKWQETKTSYGQNISTTVDNSYNEFTITLGAKQIVNGVAAFPLVLTGTPDTHAPRWKYIAIAEDGALLGSTGSSFQTIYSATNNQWLGGGFFINFKDTDGVKVSDATYKGIYNTFKAKEVSYQDATGGCESILGNTVCSDASTDTTLHEYYKQGLGAVGLHEQSYYTYSGGGFYTVHTRALYIELVSSSLSALDGTVLKTSSWAEVATLPTRVDMYSVTAVGNLIYISNANSNMLQVYNTTTQIFEQNQTITTTPSRALLHTLNSTLYLLSNESNIIKLLSNKSWEYVNTFTDNNPVTATYNNTIISIVSDNLIGGKFTVKQYDALTNTWKTFANPKENYDRWFLFDIVVVDKIVYLVGGRYLSNESFNTWSAYKKIARFDITNNTWLSEIEPTTIREQGLALLNYNGNILIMGGKDENGVVLSSIERYNPTSKSWSTLESLPEPMSDIKAVEVGNKIYVVTSNKIWKYTP